MVKIKESSSVKEKRTWPVFFLTQEGIDRREPNQDDMKKLRKWICSFFKFSAKTGVTISDIFFREDKEKTNIFSQYIADDEDSSMSFSDWETLSKIIIEVPGMMGRFLLAESWFLGGANIAVLGENMQALFEMTDFPDICISDFKLPRDESIYIALPHFKNERPASGSDIRGVYFSIYDNSVNCSIWRKPTVTKGYFREELLVCIESLDKAKDQMLREFVSDAFIRNFTASRMQMGITYDDYVHDFWRAIKIGMSAIFYWNTMEGKKDIEHPLMKERKEREEDLLNRLSKLTSKKKRRSLESQIEHERHLSALEGKWYFIEEEYPDSYPEDRQDEEDPSSAKRKSPRMHFRKGCWKTRNKKRFWTRPTIVGTGKGLAPKYWKSKFDKEIK